MKNLFRIMNQKLLFKPTLIIFICLLFSGFNAIGQWKQDQFVIGTFYDPKIGSKTLADTAGYAAKIQGVKNAYFNLLSGMDGWYDTSFISYKLGIISKVGIRTLLMNEHSWGKGNATFNQVEANQWFTWLQGLDAKKKSALYGYYIFDEPGVDRVNDIINWVSFAKSKDTKRLAYVNLLPSFVFKTRDIYENYLDTYLTNIASSAKLDVVSYDFYPFIKGGIKPDYFYNLYMLNKKSQGRPIWCYALTTAHREYTEVGNYELNFMVFSPLIYGVKGILYFTYETIVGSTMPFSNALVDAKSQPTSKYYHVKAINKWLAQEWGPIVMSSERLGTYHVSKLPYNQDIQPDEKINANTPIVASIDDPNMAVGIFRSKKNDGEYNLLFINKSASDLNNVRIALKGTYSKNNVSVSDPFDKGTGFSPLNTTINNSTHTTIINVDFDAGAGRIIKITK